jgi:hypothetical protein
MRLVEVPERPLAFDVRLDREKASKLRQAARDYSLWPDVPFGCSVDTAVWPSVFTDSRREPRGKIRVPEAAEYWYAFQLWDDLIEMFDYVEPQDYQGEVILICIDRDFINSPPAMTLTSALLDSEISGVYLNKPLNFLGFDLSDTYMTSMILNAGADEQLRNLAPERTEFGLIRDRDAALDLIPELERRDPEHAPLLLMAVYSLGPMDKVAADLHVDLTR